MSTYRDAVILPAARQVVRARMGRVKSVVWGPIIAALLPLVVEVVAQLIALWLNDSGLEYHDRDAAYSVAGVEPDVAAAYNEARARAPRVAP